MRVLQICHDFPSAVGGGATHVHHLSKELVKLGHQVTVFTTDLIGKGERASRAFEEMDGISVRRFRVTSIPMVGLDVGNIPLGMLPAILKKTDYDIVHVHSYRFFSTWIVPIVHILKPRVPIIMTSHSAHEPSRPWRIRIFDNIWGKPIFRSVARVIALTDIERGYLVSLGCPADRIRIIPNGVDSFLLDYVPNIQRFKTSFNITHEKLALFVGRIGLGKGLDILVDAIPQVLAQLGRDVLFLFVGPDWGDREALEQRARALGIEGNILFTGSLAGESLLDAYHSSAIVVLLSRFDASPLVLVEAMAAAKPVVATRVGGIPNVVREGVTGILVEPEDPTSAAAAMIRLLSDSRLAEQFGQAGKALVRARYQWNQIAGQVANLYAELSPTVRV
jgi:glycosyltransferase involved in cell wall biosynthesis